MSSATEAEEALASLRALHAEIDRESARLAARNASRLHCARGCSSCCVDDLTVFPLEAERIRRAHRALLERGRPHAPGACAFLDDAGACRIYADRPSVCRSQGLPLRLIFEDESGEIVERRDICPLNLVGGPALERLDEADCWLIGSYELRLSELNARYRAAQARSSPGSPTDAVQGEERIALRALFRGASDR